MIIPTDTVYGLAAGARVKAAVSLIFAIKGRPAEKAIAVLIADPDQAESLAELSPLAKKLIERFWPGPLTLILKRQRDAPAFGAAGTIGLRCPDCQLVRSIIRKLNQPLAVTSANISGEASPTHHDQLNPEVMEQTGLVLLGGATVLRRESSILDLAGKEPRLLRTGALSQNQLEETIETYGGGPRT